MSKPCFLVFRQNEQALMLKRYSYNHIVTMTNNFKERLDQQGGFGFESVYKGKLVTVKIVENSK